MARFPLQIVSPQNRAFIQSVFHLFVWAFDECKAKWRGFLLRFAPLWVPIVLILLLPASREIAISNGLTGVFDWLGITSFQSSYTSVFQHAQQNPNNLGAQLNAVPLTYSSLSNQIPYYGEDEAPHARDEWLQNIEKRFHEAWLPAYLVRCQMDGTSYAYGYSYANLATSLSIETAQQRRQKGMPVLNSIEKGGQSEPKNAFWVIARAWWEWNYASRPYYPPPKSNFATMPDYSTMPLAAGPSSAPGAPPMPPPSASGIVPPPPTSYSPYILSAPTSEILFLPGMAHPVALPGPHPSPPSTPDNEPVVRKTLEILRRANTCTYYDDGSTQANILMRRDRLSGSGTSLENDWLQDESRLLREISFLQELPLVLWGSVPSANSLTVRIPYAPSAPIETLGTRLNPQLLVASGAALVRIGNLIDALPQKAHGRALRPSYQWFDVGWNLDKAPILSRRRPPLPGAVSTRFAARARAIGLNEYAQEAQKIEIQVVARDSLWKRVSTRSLFIPGSSHLRELIEVDALVPPFSVWSAAFCEALSVCLLCLVPLWMFLNIFLVRGVGVPSTRPQRWGVASLLISGLFLLALWLISQLSLTRLAATRGTADLPATSVMALVLLSALVCLVATVARHHRELVNPNDDKWHTRLLSTALRPWFEPVLLGTSALLLFSVGAWFAWLLLHPTNSVSGTPIFGNISLLEVTQALAIYGLASGALSFIIWLANWRWPHKLVRPITHTGLRWWKECIGASICTLAWLYFFVAVAAWPARTQAKHMIEERWQMGDWVWLQKNL